VTQAVEQVLRLVAKQVQPPHIIIIAVAISRFEGEEEVLHYQTHPVVLDQVVLNLVVTGEGCETSQNGADRPRRIVRTPHEAERVAVERELESVVTVAVAVDNVREEPRERRVFDRGVVGGGCAVSGLDVRKRAPVDAVRGGGYSPVEGRGEVGEVE